jgi:hypothetical protein
MSNTITPTVSYRTLTFDAVRPRCVRREEQTFSSNA